MQALRICRTASDRRASESRQTPARGLTFVADVVQFPGGKSGRSGGDGPEEPMLEARVARLEDDMKEVKALLRSIEAKLTLIAESLAEIKGKVSQSPTWLQL